MTWCKNIARDAAVRAAEDNRAGPLPTLGECIDGMIPKSVSASSAQEQENKGDGMATNGLRTERVTLEVTHDSHISLCDWPSLRTFFGESVRVVEEAHFDDLAQVAMERDAAIRERDKLRGEIASVRNCWGVSRFANDVLKARVAELEAAAKLAPDANDDGGSNHAAQAASGGGEAGP
jgi:hypothetical protein